MVFRLLQRCTSAQENITQLNAGREDLCRRLDSRSALGEYTGMLYDFAGYMLTNARMTRSIVKYWRLLAGEPGTATDLCSTADLLCLFAKHSNKVTAVCVRLCSCDSVCIYMRLCVCVDVCALIGNTPGVQRFSA